MPSSPNPVRWGILGYARIARESLIPAIKRSPGSRFFALASREPSKLEACAERHGAFRAHSSYEALLADPEVEAVYLPLPNALHRPWVLRAAAAGKPILCEKPLGLTAAEVRDMRTACADAKVLLMEAFMYRYTHRTRLVREVLASGRLGTVRSVSACFRFRLQNPASIKYRPELGGGSLYDVGCYAVNFVGLVADTLAGRPGSARPEAVSASFVCSGGIDVGFAGTLRYPDGLLGVVQSGFDGHKRVGCEIVGSEGVLEVPESFFDATEPLVLVQGDRRELIPVPESDRYRSEVEDFASAVRGQGGLHLGLDESERNAAVLDRLFAAGGLKAG